MKRTDFENMERHALYNRAQALLIAAEPDPAERLNMAYRLLLLSNASPPDQEQVDEAIEKSKAAYYRLEAQVKAVA